MGGGIKIEVGVGFLIYLWLVIVDWFFCLGVRVECLVRRYDNGLIELEGEMT